MQAQSTGLIIFSYLNPILQFGLEKFCTAALASGSRWRTGHRSAGGRSGRISAGDAAHKLAPVFLAAPTSPDERLKRIARHRADLSMRCREQA